MQVITTHFYRRLHRAADYNSPPAWRAKGRGSTYPRLDRPASTPGTPPAAPALPST